MRLAIIRQKAFSSDLKKSAYTGEKKKKGDARQVLAELDGLAAKALPRLSRKKLRRMQVAGQKKRERKKRTCTTSTALRSTAVGKDEKSQWHPRTRSKKKEAHVPFSSQIPGEERRGGKSRIENHESEAKV